MYDLAIPSESMALAAAEIPVRRCSALGNMDDGMLGLSVYAGHLGEAGYGNDLGTGDR